MQNLNFCYIINENKDFHRYLIESLYSLVKSYHNIDTIYIISTHVFNEKYESLLYTICNTNKLIIKYVNKNIVDSIKYPDNVMNSKRIDKTALLKFYIPYLVDCDDIIYVDSDILFINNASEILLENINDNIMLKLYYMYHALNSGLIYFNCKLYRRHNEIFELIQNYYNDYKDAIFIDQTCILYLTNEYKDICIVDNEHTEYINFYQSCTLNISNVLEQYGCCILHFNGPYKEIMNDIFNEFVRDNKYELIIDCFYHIITI